MRPAWAKVRETLFEKQTENKKALGHLSSGRGMNSRGGKGLEKPLRIFR